MDVVLGTIVGCVVIIGLIALFVLGSLHILKCTENSQETFSWASVGETICASISAVLSCAEGLAGHLCKVFERKGNELGEKSRLKK